MFHGSFPRQNKPVLLCTDLLTDSSEIAFDKIKIAGSTLNKVPISYVTLVSECCFLSPVPFLNGCW